MLRALSVLTGRGGRASTPAWALDLLLLAADAKELLALAAPAGVSWSPATYTPLRLSVAATLLPRASFGTYLALYCAVALAAAACAASLALVACGFRRRQRRFLLALRASRSVIRGALAAAVVPVLAVVFTPLTCSALGELPGAP